MKIRVLMGGASSEREVSIHTGEGIINALKPNHDVQGVILDSSIQSVVQALDEADIVFIALHGGSGENGEVQTFLDKNKIAYTGCGPESSRTAMDKNQSKILAGRKGILTPVWQMFPAGVRAEEILLEKSFGFPFVVKPNDEGSTFGLTIVEKHEEIAPAMELASRYSKEVMIEQYIPGREITVGILGQAVLPIVEIIPSHNLYDYECKYTPGMSRYECPADIQPPLTQKIQESARSIYELLGCRDYARVDYRLDGNQFYFLEVNTLPGMTGTSLLPKAAKAVGIEYPELIETIIKLALER
ncbi:MAG: D-alanine--D-alanine ligase [FCB group bacterium]|nr:D-alanine--D-alanine ligase [FCB group bacterium]